MSQQKSTLQKVVTNLTFWVLLAVIAGILLGHYFPATAIKTKLIGEAFVEIIKVFITPIIFFTIVLGISGMASLGKVGKIGIKSLIYFEIVTTLAIGIGIVVANIIQPGKINKAGLPIQ